MLELNKEYKSFLEDIEKNIKNQEDLNYVKERFQIFLDIMMTQIDNIVKNKDEQIANIENKQQDMEDRLNKMQEVISHIEEDIYSEDGFDFEIICPYCNYQFVIDIDDNKTEVTCPECNNIIELDWTGNLEEDDENTCNGSCSHCAGCDEEPQRKPQNDDDM